jgi:hypothetical protein
MTKPVTPATWDSNGTNLSAPTAGHMTDGYAVNEVPTSTELNGQLQRIGLWTEFIDQHFDSVGDYKHGDQILNISPLSGASSFAGSPTWAPNAGGYMKSAAAGSLFIGVPLKVDDRIKSITFEVFGDGAADLAVTIAYRLGASVTTEFLSDLITNPPAAWNNHTYNVSDHQFVDGDYYWIELAANAANIQVGNIRVTFDRPL